MKPLSTFEIWYTAVCLGLLAVTLAWPWWWHWRAAHGGPSQYEKILIARGTPAGQEPKHTIIWFNEEQDRLEAVARGASPSPKSKELAIDANTLPRPSVNLSFPKYPHMPVIMGDKSYELGLRDDGVVVARESKP
jgi:hypothetical protein